ncbi:MAG: endo-chitodextinase, partial [Thermoleophilaceae bacterium]|nr:endo-chitodextinase [Thermoleophilaceae bacterium]
MAALATLMRRCVALAAFVVLLAVAVPSFASAAQHNPRGRFLGVVPAKNAKASPFSGRHALASNLTWHGGPVVHGGTAHAIYWAPPGYSFPSDYTSSIDAYFAHVAADSGKSSNVYSVARQYADGVGPTSYQVTYGGSLTDTNPFPAGDCTDPGTSPCLTDQQLTEELDGFLTAHSQPRGMNNLYFLFTPAGVGSCFDSGGQTCAFSYYCGYHSDFLSDAGHTLYANHPYASGVYGCDAGENPSGTSGDGTINVVSHEHNEIDTDPLGDAWFDADGEENADKCGFNFGTELGSTGSGDLYNQVIDGAQYYLQQEWSNADGGCVQDMAAAGQPQAPTATFTHAGSAVAGQLVTFDGSQSHDSNGTILGYAWQYGDGSTGSGKFPFHAYSKAGTYQVTLTVTDDEGATGQASAPVTIGAGATPPTETKPAVPGSSTQPVAKKHKKKKCRKAKGKKHKKKCKKPK